jgi:hypothetical protein
MLLPANAMGIAVNYNALCSEFGGGRVAIQPAKQLMISLWLLANQDTFR